MVKQPEFNTGGRGSSGKSLFRTNISGFPSCAPSQEQSLWLQAFHLKRIIGAETVLFFMFVANGGFGQVGKCSESIKALLVLVCPWLQQ